MKHTNYVLSVGKADQERLKLLNEICNPYSQAFLLAAGLKPGMKVLEIGCGTGIMSCWFAQQVTSTGHVTAIDISQEQIALAQQEAQKNSLQNINFEIMSVYELEKLAQKFDLIYSRYVLIHLAEPLKALKVMAGQLKLGGILALESGILDFCYSSPQNEFFEGWKQVCLELSNQQEVDFNFGKKSYNAFYDLGLKNIKASISSPILTTPRLKSVLAMGIESSRQSLLNIGYSEEQIQNLIAGLNTFAQDPRANCTFFPVDQVSGQRL